MTNHECDNGSSKLLKLMMLLLLLLLIMNPHEVESGSIVKYLPGFEGPLPFELETGYIGVGEDEEVQLFYYFIKSEQNPKEDPLLLWLSGGPGCSSISGLFLENGPVTFKVEGCSGEIPNLLSTTYSWTKVASIIFLDQPVGTGFSYATSQLLNTPSDSGEAKLINQFLRKWLTKHRYLISNPFYTGGDSYSGKIIPAAIQEISQGNDLGLEPHINLQGYVLGNPSTDATFEFNHRIPYAHGMALISDELYESLKRSCEGNYENVDLLNTKCLKLLEEFEKCISGINFALITRPLCKIAQIPRSNIEELLLLDVPSTHDCYTFTDLITSQWANNESVRKALHVIEGSIGRWRRCNMDLRYNRDIRSSVPYHMNNSIKGYRSLIYNGDHDMTISFVSTKAWIRSLNYSIIDYWRPWLINNQVAGFTQTYANNMTFATVKGGGHTAEYKPMESFILFQRWISGQL